MSLEPGQWLVAVIAAVLVGVAKAGVSGVGILPVAIYAQLVPAKQASGLLLPLLIVGDIFAALAYRRHAQGRHLLRLMPWAAAGVVVGYFAMNRIDDRQAKVTIGMIILALSALQVWRRARPAPDLEPATHSNVTAAAFGVVAGFTTLIANAAGPLMAIYLLAMQLPKLEFVGTAAIFFLVLNLFKVPFMVDLGLINAGSLGANLWLVPAVIAGVFAGRLIVARLNQRWFENLSLALAVAAGVKLLF